MRVVTLNLHTRRYFCGFFLLFLRKWLYECPFFLKTQYLEKFTWGNLFFPWRPPLGWYFPQKSSKYRKFKRFWDRGVFWGKSRTPGESLQNSPNLVQFSPPKLSCSSIWSFLRYPRLISWKLEILPYFTSIFEQWFCTVKSSSKLAKFWKY